MDTNNLLFETYREYWPNLQNALKDVDAIRKKISYPLLVHVFPEYEQSDTKVFIIGQQTYGWGFDQKKALFWGTSEWEDCPEYLIERIIGIYKGFQLGEKYFKTPFWSLSHRLYNSINPNSSKNGFLWSNIVRLDQSQNRPEEHIEELVCDAFPVLPYEIKITKPDVVVFFTGPYYDQRLIRTFEDAIFESINGYAAKTLARIIHKDLPYHSYRTHHPKYIYMSKQPHIFERILALVNL